MELLSIIIYHFTVTVPILLSTLNVFSFGKFLLEIYLIDFNGARRGKQLPV